MDAEIYLKRRWFGGKATLGELFLDSGPFRQCYTLEDVCREIKVDGESAIPMGRYEVVLNYSDRFQKVMPRLLNVPGFEGVLIHNGNTDKDTRGCILVGRLIVSADFVGESLIAFTDLFGKLQEFSRHGKVFITITNQPVKETA